MSVREIHRIGGYLEVDENGLLPRRVDAAAIGDAWRPAVDAVVAAYRDAWGDAVHSVYVRGSLARGLQVDGTSDLDSLAVLAPASGVPDPSEVRAWDLALERRIEAAFPFIAGVETTLIPFNEASRGRGLYAFILKHEAVCVYGDDLTGRIAPFALTSEIAFQTRYFGRHLAQFLNEYPNEPTEDKPAFLTWLMRRFLRLGMELVMVEEGRYTRDLTLCYESFARHYPEQAEAMYRALELAIDPEPGESTDAFVASFGGWLAGEAERTLTGWGTPQRR